MIIHALRLNPNDDLKKSILEFAQTHQISAGCILTGLGSLKISNLRFANKKQGAVISGFQEIVSFTGTFSDTAGHFHISLANENGEVTGGHLLDGNLIHTTAEIVMLQLPDFKFNREYDQNTGYKELAIVVSSDKL
ncbi:MAG: DNA-binding protein [Moraxellaceae bacterium]|nr:DNA-binding protein [Pseudobdellovibrionaceae bacterium]